jgi:translation initiation factor IF-3
LSRPFTPRFPSSANSFVRVNGKIRAREVRVIGEDSNQLGVFSLGDAISMARAKGVDLVEIAPNATPPVCRLVDYGKFRYEQSKKEKEARKHQHANKVKEIQLSATIDPHDFGVKLNHAIDFLCDEMKVKATLRFRGREMAHQQYGFQVMEKLTKALVPYGHPDAPPKLIGRGLNVMFSPLPRNKRAKNPHQTESGPARPSNSHDTRESTAAELKPSSNSRFRAPSPESPAAFANNPFAELELKSAEKNAADSPNDNA